jgi:dienelactone hydrolase
MQAIGYGESHRDTAAGQSQDDRIPGVLAERRIGCQQTARFQTIREWKMNHDRTPSISTEQVDCHSGWRLGKAFGLATDMHKEERKAGNMSVGMRVPAGRVELAADLSLPESATGLVLFAHGSGSSRHSPRNRHVADVLNRGSIGTILTDLLTEDEEAVDLRTAELRFDIDLLVRRLTAITDWIGAQKNLNKLGLGYFGASTGAAAALGAAADRHQAARAVVSRGGRPDLAGEALGRVLAPCLFIVGEDDPVVVRLNREAIAELPHQTERRLEIIPGATHLFEEPGALDRVAELARGWFQKYLK